MQIDKVIESLEQNNGLRDRLLDEFDAKITLGADFVIINVPSEKLGKAAYYFEKKLQRIVKKFSLYSGIRIKIIAKMEIIINEIINPVIEFLLKLRFPPNAFVTTDWGYTNASVKIIKNNINTPKRETLFTNDVKKYNIHPKNSFI